MCVVEGKRHCGAKCCCVKLSIYKSMAKTYSTCRLLLWIVAVWIKLPWLDSLACLQLLYVPAAGFEVVYLAVGLWWWLQSLICNRGSSAGATGVAIITFLTGHIVRPTVPTWSSTHPACGLHKQQHQSIHSVKKKHVKTSVKDETECWLEWRGVIVSCVMNWLHHLVSSLPQRLWHLSHEPRDWWSL